MLEHAHERLLRWADWALSERRAKGLGYSACTLARWAVPSSTFRADPSVDVEAGDSDDAIRVMCEQHRTVLVVFYLAAGTHQQKAGDLRCSVATMYRKLEAAQSAFCTAVHDQHAARKLRIEKSSFR